MDNSLLNFQFYKSFRMPMNKSDKVHLTVSRFNDDKFEEKFPAEIININLTGLNFSSIKKLRNGERVNILVHTKRWFNNWDFELKGEVVRSFLSSPDNNEIVYGIRLDKVEKDSELHYFLKDFINRFSSRRLREYLVESAIAEKKVSTKEGIELFSLMTALYTGSTTDNIEDVLQTATEILGAEAGRIYKVKIEAHKLENIHSSDLNLTKEYDYREGLPGRVFTSSSLLNLDLRDMKKHPYISQGITSAIAHPLHNKEHKTIGVIEFTNKIDGKRFSVRDERFLKLVSNIISHYFEDFVPHSRISLIQELNPIEKSIENLYIGTSKEAEEIRKVINTLKSSNENVLIVGEKGVGKKHISIGLHEQGSNAIYQLHSFECKIAHNYNTSIKEELEQLNLDEPGTILLKEPAILELEAQKELYEALSRSKMRIITICSKDLLSLVENGKFLKKLYFFLSKAHIHLRPLRNRSQNIIEIANTILIKEANKRNLDIPKLDDETIDRILAHNWPGNIKELERSIVKALMRYNPGDEFFLEILPSTLKHKAKRNQKMYQIIQDLCNKSDKSLFFDTQKKILRESLRKKKSA